MNLGSTGRLPIAYIAVARTFHSARSCRAWLSFAGLALLAVLALEGCAGYRLGPTNGATAGEKSVQIQPFANHTIEARLNDAVTSQLRKELQRDGTYHLATHNDGDIIVSGVITRYQRFEMSFALQDTLTVRDFRLVLTAQVTARERSTGKVLFDRPLSGNTMIRITTDMTSTERQAMPLLAADLARTITSQLVDGSW